MAGSPLYPLLNEINTAATKGLPFLALIVTVALPDICASLASADGRTSPELYKAWCDANLPKEQFSHITAADLYSIRCGVLHNGRFGDLKHTVSRVIFFPPGPPYMTFGDNLFRDAYGYGVVEFCRNFTNAVYNWMEANQADPIIQANLPRLMQYRPGGLPDYITGPTVIA